MNALPVPHSEFNVHPPSIDESHRVSRAIECGFHCMIVGGLITLCGWAFDIRRLTDWNNDDVSMFANTAAGVVVGGIAVILLRFVGRHDVCLLAALPRFAIGPAGALTTIEHLANVDCGIDSLLFSREWGQRAVPRRCGWDSPLRRRSS